ncbi:putative 1,3-beta-glucanosyltransferase [Planoprotostelium fungivorum]|uniref:Putative 1,3-beta-glucanosyltransferase n=1 Tax=Planoprotostelium fungivorum TaxID=1890364 RepID=A0A2P6NQU7_9EUKA|nr:putative 1,3-beta-glucanosyltransferase [Planoprotostelium fungivorum]
MSMAYSPSPLAKVVDGQNYGTGLCTPKRAYSPGSYNNIQMTSPCFLEDYFDGTVYPGGPSGGWWNGVWQRDFPLMKQLGVNTLRIYHADPITSQEVSSNPKYNDKSIIGANHIPFLDLAQSYGFKVIFPLYAPEAGIATLSQAFMFEYIENLIDEVGYHPAVLMYQFGNELQFLNNDNSYVDKVNTYLDHAKNYQIQRWGRSIPVSTALIDYPPYYNSLVPALKVDVITTNAGYRGFDFQNLWSGGGSSFLGLKTLSCLTGKPVLIGEMGVHSHQSSSAQFDVAQAFPRMTSDLVVHKSSGAIGGVYFEWQEEHWKGVASTTEDWTQAADVFMGAISLTPGSGQFPVDVAHTKVGTAYDWSGAVQAFSMDPFSSAAPLKLSVTQSNLCAGISGGLYSPGTVSAADSNPPASAFTPTTQSPSTTSQLSTGTSSCTNMYSQLTCKIASEDPSQTDSGKVSGARNWLCSNYAQFCVDINGGGTYSNCNAVEQLSYAMNLYYKQFSSQGVSACSFGGIGQLYTPASPSTTSQPVIVNPSPAPTTVIPAPTTASPTPTTSTGQYCPSWLSQCGDSCYRPSEYNCQNQILSRKDLPATTSDSNDGNVFPPNTGGACGNLASCNGQCYDPKVYTCTKDSVNSNPVLCYGANGSAASCNGQCYNPSTYKCNGGGLVLN